MLENKLLKILKEELIVAVGCTEPLALAYAGSLAKYYLNGEPKKIQLDISTNIFKNVRCVSIPDVNIHKGVIPSVLLGLFGGDHTKGFSCIEGIGDKYNDLIQNYIDDNKVSVNHLNNLEKLYIKLTVSDDINVVKITIKDSHLNVVEIIRNNEIIFENKTNDDRLNYDKELLSFDNIYQFSKNINLSEIEDVIRLQYEYNLSISEEGFKNDYGVNIGKIILKNDNSIWGKIKAYTASGSEARMCGNLMPVIINSGSGNQGLSSSVPVIIYGQEKKKKIEDIYRALIFSNLLTIKQKKGIGTLSAYCGIVASCGSAGAAITFLSGGTKEQVIITLKNYLANVPGIICDGAKASCASKISTAMDAAILSHQLALENKQYADGSGIIKKSIDETIDIISDIANQGMKTTDDSIIKHLIRK